MKNQNDWTLQTRLLCALTMAISLSAVGSLRETHGQSVGLPAPRLLNIFPMGGKAGTRVEVTVSGEFIDELESMVFSDSHFKAEQKRNAEGAPIPNTFLIDIAADCPTGLYEARLMTRLGMSTPRIFSVGKLDEVSVSSPITTLATASAIPMNSVCNATISVRAVNFHTFEAKQGQRVVVDCAARGIDSKLTAVVTVADATGRDLVVERRGAPIDFSVPADGKYVVKVHELTYQGGPAYYYRLAVSEQPRGADIVAQASTKTVSSFSWPPTGMAERAALAEAEPNNDSAHVQKITLPCDISAAFFPAADVDYYEFTAKKGETWWIELASERFDLPTDAAVVVQKVTRNGEKETVADVLELSDIPSPIKVSSNGYAYDGPPYNPGTTDVLGKFEVKEDGTYRLRVSDLFGGTRSDPHNIYRLVIRQGAPDFALVGWALHMELRNGDRNAVSKPMALRRGTTMAIEVVAMRRDGFNDPIELVMEGLPAGVKASGLTIPAGKSRGILLLSAAPDAPGGFTNVNFFGRANIGGTSVSRPCRIASMAWPVLDHWQEIPSPRLLTDTVVSVSDHESAPLMIAAVTPVVEAKVNEKLLIPLAITRRCDFSGTTVQLKTLGNSLDRLPQFNLKIDQEKGEAVIDLAALKVAPGEYTIAFYGGAVAKYSYNPEAVARCEEEKKRVEREAANLADELKKLDEESKKAPDNKKPELKKTMESMSARQKSMMASLNAATNDLKKAADMAQPKDIVDIVISEPIVIRVAPGEKP